MPSDGRARGESTGSSRRPPTRRALLAASTTVASAGLAGCLVGSDPAEAERVTATYSVPPATAVAVSNVNGDVVVEPRLDGEDIEAEVVKRTREDRDRLDRVSVAATVADGRLELETEYEGALSSGAVSVDLTVRVPTGNPLAAARTGNGTVTATDVAGDATLRSLNGDVRARRVDGFPELATTNGRVEAVGAPGIAGARTANGAIDVTVRRLRGELRCRAGNGDVDVGVASDVDAAVRLSTGNGEVTVEGLSLTDRTGSEGHVTGHLGEGFVDLTCESGNGDVRLYGLTE